jgi:hypothetical protein
MLTRKDSTIVSFRIEKKEWDAFRKKCKESNASPIELIRSRVMEMIDEAYDNETPAVDDVKYSYDSHNKTIRYEGVNKNTNKSHILAEYPADFLETLLEDNINLAKNLIDIKNKHLSKSKGKVRK